MERTLFDAVAKLDEKHWMFYGKSLFAGPYLRPSGDKIILDAGCGTGPMLAFLAKWGDVVGLDASQYALSLAARYASGAKVTLKEGDVSSMPFPDATFDVVTLFDVLYHRDVKDDDEVIRECRRVLKDRGLLIVSDSAFKFLKTSYDEEAHVARRYTLPEMKRKFIMSGFKIKKASYIFFFIFPVVMLIRYFKNLGYPRVGEKERIFALHPLANMVMRYVMAIEAALLKVVNFPFGVSVFCVGIKNGER